MTYESKWKAIIDKEWSTFTKKWEAENSETKMMEMRFTFMNMFLQEKYREESDDVKAEEEVAGDENKVELDVRNQGYQKAIDKLPKTLATIGESIQQQTGWNISFLVGGPEPGQNGWITTYMLHCGKSANNQNFEEFLGNEGYNTHIVGPFDDFLHESFHKWSSIMSLGSKEMMPELAEGEAEQGNSHVDAEGSHGKDQIEVKCKKSQYELTREANIAKNIELFKKIREQYPLPEDLKPEPVRKARKAKGKKKGNDEPIRTSTRLATGPSDKPNEEQGQGTDQTLTSPECDTTLDSPPPADFDASTCDGMALPGSTSSSLLVPAGTVDVASAPGMTQALASLDPEPSASSMDVDTMNGAILPPSLTSIDNHQGNIVPMDVDGVNGAAALTSVDNHQGKSVLLEVNIEDETASPPAPKTVSMRVDQVGDPINSVDTSNLPAWLMSNGRLDYLCGVSKEGGWQNLVVSLLKFEMENKVTGNLPTTSRPEVIAAWIKSKKKDVMPKINADEYGSSFTAWWIAIQPKWRLADDSSFVYSMPASEDWCFLHKGGSSGLYIVVIALSWWVKALTLGESQIRVSTAIHNITWVINQIYKKVLPASNGKK
ncbi:hypothetical protein CPB84DRAFT_1753656 [Gymnopilus junonius]|uniref:Uncharacterized protein n=1 Tax=Gymnopilus junonius TaxID=109634 RepID=A0A9P5NAN7_GYMJU|nr:hypothetical protein CPB84DRAFT_1753656 [Gymnopilus junonius]